MRRFVTVLLLVVVVGFLGGCSSRNNSAPGVPEVGDDVGREAQATSYDIRDRFHDWGDNTASLSKLDGWTYYNTYYDRTEIACPSMSDKGKVNIFREYSGSWIYDTSLDVDADTGGSSDDCAVVKVTGCQSNDEGSHALARLLVVWFNDQGQYITVYRGTNNSSIWTDSPDVDWDVGEVYDGSTLLDVDLAPDGEFLIIAYYYNSDFNAQIWDTYKYGGSASAFFGDVGDEKWDNKIADNNCYGVHAQVAMGAYNFNANDHSFAYSIPGYGRVYLYQQGANNETWTYRTYLGFASWDVDIACDDGTDYLFCWSQEPQQAKFYTLSSSAWPTNQDTFSGFGLYSSSGGINGLAWIAAGCQEMYGDDYIEIFLQCSIDGWVEGFGNFD